MQTLKLEIKNVRYLKHSLDASLQYSDLSCSPQWLDWSVFSASFCSVTLLPEMDSGEGKWGADLISSWATRSALLLQICFSALSSPFCPFSRFCVWRKWLRSFSVRPHIPMRRFFFAGASFVTSFTSFTYTLLCSSGLLSCLICEFSFDPRCFSRTAARDTSPSSEVGKRNWSWSVHVWDCDLLHSSVVIFSMSVPLRLASSSVCSLKPSGSESLLGLVTVVSFFASVALSFVASTFSSSVAGCCLMKHDCSAAWCCWAEVIVDSCRGNCSHCSSLASSAELVLSVSWNK